MPRIGMVAADGGRPPPGPRAHRNRHGGWASATLLGRFTPPGPKSAHVALHLDQQRRGIVRNADVLALLGRLGLLQRRPSARTVCQNGTRQPLVRWHGAGQEAATERDKTASRQVARGRAGGTDGAPTGNRRGCGHGGVGRSRTAAGSGGGQRRREPRPGGGTVLFPLAATGALGRPGFLTPVQHGGRHSRRAQTHGVRRRRCNAAARG